MHWGINKLYRIGTIENGYYEPRGARGSGGSSEVTYVVDPGPADIFAWYYDDNASGNHMSHQTGVVKMSATLKPNGRYELRSTRAAGKLQFNLYDIDSNAIVAESGWVDILVKPLLEPPGMQGVPIFHGLIHHWK
jgi:hypothetical protein